MKTLHILLKDRAHELQTEVPDNFELSYPEGCTPTTDAAFIMPDLFVNLSEVVAMWVTEGKNESYDAGYRDAVARATEWFNGRGESICYAERGLTLGRVFQDYMVEGVTKEEE